MEPILKDLCALIRKSTIHYNETCEQKDVILTEEFQELYGEYLRNHNYNVDFYKYTAVITTPIGNYMFVPNQWFVIAAYAVGVFTELMEYKKYLLLVCEYMDQKPKLFIPKMRDETSSIDKKLFYDGCRSVFNGSEEEVLLASDRLWRFATDYAWWSGNKTIDRGDFYLSVILNMLSLVNASQSYVGEIVSDYEKAGLSELVAELANFTETADGPTYEIDDYRDPHDVVREVVAEIDAANDDDDGTEFIISVRSKQ